MNRRDCLMGLGTVAALALRSDAAGAVEATARAPAILGPDPDTRTPIFRPPPFSCDTHTHIFGPDAIYPFSAERTYTPPEAPLAMFKALHAKIGFERAVVVNATLHGFDNRVATDAIAQSGGFYRGVANVTDSMSETDLQALDAAGIRGCRFIFLKRFGGVANPQAFQRIVARAAALKWHVVIYLDTEAVVDFAPLLRALPTPYLIDHMGTISAAKGLQGANFQALLDLQRSDEKCWVKISGPERASATGAPFHDAVPFAKALIDGAPDRVVWGSDWPHPNLKVMPNDGDLVDLIPLYAPDPGVRQKLLVDNPARLYRFDGAL